MHSRRALAPVTQLPEGQAIEAQSAGFGVLRQSRSFRAAKTLGDEGPLGDLECCGKAAAFVPRRILATKGTKQLVYIPPHSLVRALLRWPGS